ncbi:MAG TPA: Fe-S cluster assembly ATPase SufC [Deltaproteobacteria bacterium]|nr:Fe-S cluster assembly ATPase SufC [Deltaproteobacteria bacterium]
MLELIDLHAEIEGTPILKGLSLSLGGGEVHAIMGPNASGKSTLAKVITGHPDYRITSGGIRFEGRSILDLGPEERARLGIFLSFQHPIEIPGVSTAEFLKAAVNATRRARGQPEVDAAEFLRLARERMALVEMDPSLLKRSLNEGFSGGEKKRNEIFQMAMLEPRLAILDEPDSGLDVDALRIVASGCEALRSPERTMLVITHYQRLLDHLTPDHTHILLDGRIVRSGGPELAQEVEARGYQWVRDEVAA